jgi:hypothetical protein
MQDQAASATASAQAVYATLTDKIIDAWSESELKKFCDENGINGLFLVPVLRIYANPCQFPKAPRLMNSVLLFVETEP